MNLYHTWTKPAEHCGDPRELYIWAHDALAAKIALGPYLKPTERVELTNIYRVQQTNSDYQRPTVLQEARKQGPSR